MRKETLKLNVCQYVSNPSIETRRRKKDWYIDVSLGTIGPFMAQLSIWCLSLIPEMFCCFFGGE